VDAGEVLRSDAPFVAYFSAWWRAASLSTQLRALVSNAILEKRILRSDRAVADVATRVIGDLAERRPDALALVRVASRSSQAGRVVRFIEGTDELVEVRSREDGRCPFRERPI
jgi:hypothetical protein